MKTPEQLYTEIHRNKHIEDPRSFAEYMAYSPEAKISHQERDKWHEVVLMIDEDWEEMTGGMETAEISSHSDADAGL
ncbi:MAG: hypothetical protein F2563_03555 [Actinobacteria bacterium]|uniref:Unannotated protein n=1 Tax=freshwater metagenome TaxID=449393 RepID=A0A6J6ER85_9ZZZZ|nr:hypothetical protein [Actinomycetota bacterium]